MTTQSMGHLLSGAQKAALLHSVLSGKIPYGFCRKNAYKGLLFREIVETWSFV